MEISQYDVQSDYYSKYAGSLSQTCGCLYSQKGAALLEEENCRPMHSTAFLQVFQLYLIFLNCNVILLLLYFSISILKIMGCNQSSTSTSIHQIRISEIPCTPEQIGIFINSVRANPKMYAQKLQKELEKFTDQYSIALDQDILYRTNQGKQVWREAIDFLKKVEPLGKLTIHNGLCKAALVHAEDLSFQKDLSHTGSDGSQPLDRLVRFCKKGVGKTGQNIGTDFKLRGRNYAQNTVIGLIIDDGVSDRGHRLSIFDKDFHYYGSASRVQGDKIITVINYLSKDWETID